MITVHKAANLFGVANVKRLSSRCTGWVLIVLALAVSGCQTTSFYKSEKLDRLDDSLRILVMALDVELSELSAGGAAVPNAAWTEKAIGHIKRALKREFAQRQAKLALYKIGPADEDPGSVNVQLVKLHQVVGGIAMLHQLAPAYRLPNKGEKFDWTLGPEVRSLAREYDADFALFLHIRDSYTSGGRAVVIIAAALLGVAMQGGTQVGYATLIDLNSGDVVWFNVLARGHGDLRVYDKAEETIQSLLLNFPK